MAMCLGFSAYAQDTSTWKPGDNVTNLLQWEAYEALDEDPANPVWQGFKYGASGEWEFRPAEGATPGLQTADANDNKCFICWGVYNLPPVDVYQEFEMPAGIYTVSVSGCYRDGQDDNTLSLYKTGNPTENCFVYVQVGEDVYQTPMQYKFDASITERVTPEEAFANNNWGNEKGYSYNGTTIYSPQSHCCADWFLDNGKFAGNSVLFAVPEKMVVRVGIKKPVAVPQDQIWWNHWTMTYNSEFNDAAKAMIAKQNFDKLLKKAEDFIEAAGEKYPALGALLGDDIQDIDVNSSSSLEEINEAMAQLQELMATNEAILTKADALAKNLDICEGILKVTDFEGKAAFKAVIDASSELLFSNELPDGVDLQTYINQAEALMEARMAYLLSQAADTEGTKDLTHALSFPWWVNQENTGVHDADGYHYPQNVIDAFNVVDDAEKSNLETGTGKKGDPGTPVTFEAVASKAHWSIDPDAENTWVYDDKWGGWHGGMTACIQKLKGYAGINSDWSNGANATGAMWVYQNLNYLPDGFYSLEGNVWHNANAGDGAAGWEINNNYMFINDGEGNELAKVMQVEESRGYWDGWDPSMYTTLKTDFVEIKGGKARMGYSSNTWMLISITELKYYGSSIDYNSLIQLKMDEAAGNLELSGLWAADTMAIHNIIAQIQLPVSDGEAYKAALAIVDEAKALKDAALAAVRAYDLPGKYDALFVEVPLEAETEIIAPAMDAAGKLGTEATDSYTDIPAAKALYEAYVSYLSVYEEADNYKTVVPEIVNILNEQTADLKTGVATVAKLNAYESALSGPINKAKFINGGADKATEANPMDVTDLLLQNADLSQGPKTGWTLAGEDVNPTINTYGRQIAECWNQKPFVISQTMRNLPAGTYEFSVRACYRDGSGVNQEMIDRNNAGEGHNAVIFANNGQNGVSEPVTMVTEGEWTTPSFTEWYKTKEAEYIPEGGMADWDGTICILVEEAGILDADALIDFRQEMNTANQGEAYPFDTKVGDNYYPASMCGFQYRIKNSPEAYVNKIQIYVPEGGDLTVGIKKVVAVANDWLIYDDFKLLYLGKEISSGINSVSTVADGAIFNVAGQRLNAPQKGINIINGKKVYVK